MTRRVALDLNYNYLYYYIARYKITVEWWHRRQWGKVTVGTDAVHLAGCTSADDSKGAGTANPQ